MVGKRCSCSGMMCVVAMHERRACLAGHDNKEVVSFVTLRCIALHCVRAGLQMQHATCNMQHARESRLLRPAIAWRPGRHRSGAAATAAILANLYAAPNPYCRAMLTPPTAPGAPPILCAPPARAGCTRGYLEYSVLGVPQCGADLSKQDLLERAAHKLK